MPDPWVFFLVATLGFLFAGALAPFEALGWWAGWFAQEESRLPEPDKSLTLPANPKPMVVFLSGINAVSGEAYAEREVAFLAALQKAMPNYLIINDIFPYSVIDRPLTGQRLFARLWRWALHQKNNGRALMGFIINLRNGWQVAVSADRRYGEMYNAGTAEVIFQGLLRHGYQVGSGQAVSLLGYSGGGQVAVGAVPYLRQLVRAPVFVVTLGGVVSSDPGLLSADRVVYLYGSSDRVQQLGAFCFPGRWPLLNYSSWNQGKQLGIIQTINMGAKVKHTGKGGYLDKEGRYATGKNYLEHTVETIKTVLERSLEINHLA